ncbi:unnamed protein product [Didymodactylos carnosus]|uniref:Intradiol ring-cleavage dioxygenases domain-containing protein n=1 Tax=Didymodactylos carnosus TaxID=1234261 RepID=A0A8S2ITU5_9BILA|nr:unnamed protein product [Didymodactylos carnosus]CAF3757825.1 unnamed protein product [Didymodactylos carnosus]
MIIFLLLLLLIHANGQDVCLLTDSDELGNNYVPNAPLRKSSLCDNTPSNDRLLLSGRVYDFSKKCGNGIPNVTLEVWQANYNGLYSTNENDWTCRGVFITDKYGNYNFSTILPGRESDGLGGYRPANIHFKITANGFHELVTQLYFYGDMFLSPNDTCQTCNSSSPTLVIELESIEDFKTAEGYWEIFLNPIQSITSTTTQATLSNLIPNIIQHIIEPAIQGAIDKVQPIVDDAKPIIKEVGGDIQTINNFFKRFG